MRLTHNQGGDSQFDCSGSELEQVNAQDMEEGRKRVLATVAGILVARHLKTPEDLGDTRPSPRMEYLISSAVQWAYRIMNKIDGVFDNPSGDEKRWPRA